MPALLSKPAIPYGVGDDYRIESATSEGLQRGRRMPREPFALQADDHIMPFPAYGILRQRFGLIRGQRAVRVVMHEAAVK